MNNITGVSLDDLNNAHLQVTGGRTISFVIPTASIKIRTHFKPAAFLHRRGPFPCAVSGWPGIVNTPYVSSEADFTKLDSAYWVKDVFEVAKALEFTFRCLRTGISGRETHLCIERGPGLASLSRCAQSHLP